MTIAICIKVNDGIVLATDSASTLSDKNGVIKVYENADKLANLYMDLPVGIITWGAGSIGSASTATLIKDFRKRIMGFDADPQKWSVNKTEYTVQEIANRFKEFIFDDIYGKYYSEQQNFVQGFLIAGYSVHSDMAEVWKIQIVKDKCFGPEPVMDNEKCGINWFGKTEAVVRLVFGIDPMLESILRKSEIKEEKIQKIMKSVTNSWSTDLISDPMPIQDAVDLGRFLVELTKSYFRFKPGAAIVGGPTEVAAITKHEGFKWITRKLYYDRELNLE